jgi:hypothetical protein
MPVLMMHAYSFIHFALKLAQAYICKPTVSSPTDRIHINTDPSWKSQIFLICYFACTLG